MSFGRVAFATDIAAILFAILLAPVFKIFEVCSFLRNKLYYSSSLSNWISYPKLSAAIKVSEMSHQNILKNSAGSRPVLGVLPSAICFKEDRNYVSVRGPSRENSFSLKNVHRILPERNI